MISARHSLVLCVVLVVALVPTLIHSYAGAVIADGYRTAAIPTQLAGFISTPSDRSATWGTRRFNAHDWLERRYTSAGDEVVLTVVRSYDLKALYHHPELAVAYGPSFRRAEVRHLPQDPSIPVHVLLPAPGSNTVGMYVLRYGDQFVDDPIWFQIRTAGALLIQGRQAMTLFFVTEPRAPGDSRAEDLGAARLLFAAIRQFLGTH